ncbi:hypothetical protein RA27_22200 [Ruegeria sp. ANG-R]|uniref:hypothetical protein n=1 Tax=Ruegeria sp. ANG-R TaxID=1577903 RepID=UPI00057ECBB1|nr:hypothetical protein [Ruegeria sp. ANG-R]KIC36465.1 hypothetical protein RA27_22200 [Ruegeria sp. ANG-R]
MPKSSIDSTASAVARLIEIGRKQVDDFGIACVVNVASGEYRSEFDRSIEYFTEEELEEIVGGFREAGFYTDVFVGEDSFIRWVDGGGLNHFARNRTLVYNTAQTGSAPGRKSLIPAFCQLHGISTLNANPYAVSLSRQKFHVNAILRSVGIPAPECHWYVGEGRWLADRRPPIGRIVLAKASFEAASIGLEKRSRFEFTGAEDEFLEELVAELSQPILVQEFIEGREAETPVLCQGNDVLTLDPVGISIGGEKNPGSLFLDYSRVCNDDYGFYDFAPNEQDLAHRLKAIARQVVDTLQFGGFARVDVRIRDGGEPLVTDVATSPHLVRHSAYGHRFANLGGRSAMASALVGLAVLNKNKNIVEER